MLSNIVSSSLLHFILQQQVIADVVDSKNPGHPQLEKEKYAAFLDLVRLRFKSLFQPYERAIPLPVSELFIES